MTYILVALVCGGIGAMVGSGKGRGGLGFLLGFLLSVVGIIIVAVLDPSPEARTQAASAAEAPRSIESTLRRLEALKAAGTLSESEYAAQRARVLGSL